MKTLLTLLCLQLLTMYTPQQRIYILNRQRSLSRPPHSVDGRWGQSDDVSVLLVDTVAK